MTSKKLLNDPATCVSEAVEGIILTQCRDRIRRLGNLNVLFRPRSIESMDSEVALISGGGSGHEPAHWGYVGEGMLTAAVAGNVFASPSVSSILACIRKVTGRAGALLIVKNYTGDRLNFGMALEKAVAEGLSVKMVVVADDCALEDGKGITGGRGIAGTVFVHKIAGAVAKRRATLDEVHTLAKLAADSVSTMGVALSTCTVPGVPPSNRLDGNLIELGMGIHGETGRQHMEIPAADAAAVITDAMLEHILSSKSITLAGATGKLCLLVNNLGATPSLEQYVITRHAILALKKKGYTVCRAYVGNYMTALEMAGVSISVLTVPDDRLQFLDLLDETTNAHAWTPSADLLSAELATAASEEDSFADSSQGIVAAAGPSCSFFIPVLRAICARIIENEPTLTEYDSICGDGDCGVVMKSGATLILQEMVSIEEAAAQSASSFCSKVADVISASMGGTSGALIELMLRNMAAYFISSTSAGSASWPEALVKGVDAIQFYGGASIGMRTMLDALVPASNELLSSGDIVLAAARAHEGAKSTMNMKSLAGRSNYIEENRLAGTPDPGAIAAALCFQTAADVMR